MELDSNSYSISCIRSSAALVSAILKIIKIGAYQSLVMI